MPVTSDFDRKRQQGSLGRHRVSKAIVAKPYRARLEALGDIRGVREALLVATAYLHSLAGCDDPATRAEAKEAIRAVEEELCPLNPT